MINIQAIDQFEEMIAGEDVVVALLSDLSCNVCLAIYPELEAMGTRYPKAKFISMDVEATRLLVGRFNVFVYPTIIVFVQGKESVRFERLFSMGDIEEKIDRYYGLLYG